MKLIAILFTLLCFPLCLMAENRSIDDELSRLEKKMHEIRLKIMRSEVKSQSYLKYEWGDYTHEVEEAGEYEKTLEMLEDEYNKLLKEKAEAEKK